MEKGIFESSHPHKVYFNDGLESSLNAILHGKKNFNILVATNTSLADSATIEQIKSILKHQITTLLQVLAFPVMLKVAVAFEHRIESKVH